jgi:putative sigma-54 modulation protein
MQVAITCRHGSIRPELREYITRKSEKIVRYLDTVSEIDVTIEFEGPRVDVEMLVEIDGFHTIVAHVEGEDAGATFDRTLHKMEHQVLKYKERHRDHRHKTSIADAVQQAEEIAGKDKDTVPEVE